MTSPAPADFAGRVEVPSFTTDSTILPKWTMTDAGWVSAPYELTRGPNGLSDRPARSPLALEVKPTQKEPRT
jgi:hypothetical protein